MQEWQEVVNSSKLLSGMNSANLTAWQVTFKLNPWLFLLPAQSVTEQNKACSCWFCQSI